MQVEHPELEPFRPIVTRLMSTVHTSGIQALESEGLRITDIQQDVRARRRFMRGCHYGYDLAQRQIGELVIDFEHKILAAEQELKRLRRLRDPRTRSVLEKIRALQSRQIILRRLVDSILCTILHFQVWILRRLSMENRIRRIDPGVLRRTLDIAVARNRGDRLKFSLVADLTTVVQVGDLVEVEWSPPSGGSWKVIELKEGRVNNILSGLLEEKQEVLSAADLAQIGETLGKHAPKQARRMLAQRARLREFQKIVETDHGIDPQYKVEVNMTPDLVKVDGYGEAVRATCDGAHVKGVSVAIVNGCLRLVGITREKMPNTDIGLLRHLFFHLAHPGEICKLGNRKERSDELAALSSVPPFVDLVQQNTLGQWGLPIFVWEMNPERIIDLATGQIRLFAQFDMEAFFKVAEAEGIKMTWIVGKEAEKLKKFSARIPGSPNAWGVRAELPDGNVQELLSGFFARAIVDLTSPGELLKLVKRFPEQDSKIARRMAHKQDP